MGIVSVLFVWCFKWKLINKKIPIFFIYQFMWEIVLEQPLITLIILCKFKVKEENVK